MNNTEENKETTSKTENPYNYPNPIPPPPTEGTYPNLTSIETYIFHHAAHHGFEISVADTRDTHIHYKCSLGPHGHKTKGHSNSTDGPESTTNPLRKTCPYKITARRRAIDHQWHIEIINGTHDHPPHSKPPIPRQPPKSRRPKPDDQTDTEAPQLQTPSKLSQLLPPHPQQQSHPHLFTQYQKLIKQMYSLPTKDQARLLNRFLRDCEVLQDHLIDSLTGVDLEDKDLKGKASSRASKFKPNRTENEEADKLAENNPKEEETVDDSQKQPASKTEHGDCNKTKKKHDIDTENIDTENHTSPAFNKQDEVIEQPYHPPTRSDCSSPSHQAEELLILNSLTPKRAKARLHLQSNPTKRDAGQHSSSHEDHSTTDSTRPKPQTIEDQVPTIDTTTQNTSLLLPSNVGSTSAVNPSSPLPFVEEILNNLPTKEQSATLPPKEQSKPNDNTNTLQCEISKEDNQSIPLTNDAVPSKNSVKSRKRKATDVTRQPTRVSARRKAAESKKESGENPKISPPEEAESLTTALHPISTTATGPKLLGSEVNPTLKNKRLKKAEAQKPMTPEQLEEAKEIEASVLKKWPFLKDVPRYIFPFITAATNVPGNGLCAFATVAVSLGQNAGVASLVRKQLSEHVHSKYDWYKEHLPKMSGELDINRMITILDSHASIALPDDWYPMPSGGFIIANTYQRPVIYYSPSDSISKVVFPCFSPLDTTIPPIIMAFIDRCHFIPLEVLQNNDLPIPFVHPEWFDLCDPVARNWSDLYKDNIEIFSGVKWQRDWIADETRLLQDIPPRSKSLSIASDGE